MACKRASSAPAAVDNVRRFQATSWKKSFCEDVEAAAQETKAAVESILFNDMPPPPPTHYWREDEIPSPPVPVPAAASVAAIKQKTAVYYLLDESKEDDRNWIQQQEERNDNRIKTIRTVFPSWMIVAQKWVRVEYTWTNADLAVVLEQYPNKRGYFTGIRLTWSQWAQLQLITPTILDYVRACESGTSWKDLVPLFRGHQLIEKDNNVMQIRIHMADMIFITITTMDKGGCQVDVREFAWEKENAMRLVPIPRGLTLIGGGFHFLAKYLTPKINAALTMYSKLFEQTREDLKMCFADENVELKRALTFDEIDC